MSDRLHPPSARDRCPLDLHDTSLLWRPKTGGRVHTSRRQARAEEGLCTPPKQKNAPSGVCKVRDLSGGTSCLKRLWIRILLIYVIFSVFAWLVASLGLAPARFDRLSAWSSTLKTSLSIRRLSGRANARETLSALIR